MRIHEETNYGRSESTCGYCRESGHNQYNCPKVKKDWAFFSKYQIPNDGQGNVTTTGWYRYPRDWGSWYEHCSNTYREIIRREKAATTLQGKPKKAQRTCGFCGSKDHTRRNCTKMTTFLKDCHEANIKWRKAAYKELVQLHGISVGAAVIVSEKDRWHSTGAALKEHNGIITSINWDKINVFTALDKKHDDAYSPIQIRVLLSSGKSIYITDKLDSFDCLGEAAKPRVWGSCNSLKKIIAPSKTPLQEDWITGYKESFKTLVKKRSLEQLENGMPSSYRAPNLVSHIKAWK